MAMLPPKLTLFLSTPSVRRATVVCSCCGKPLRISIHALREEGDPPSIPHSFIRARFLSTPSVRRATSARTAPLPCCIHFYPRPP